MVLDRFLEREESEFGCWYHFHYGSHMRPVKLWKHFWLVESRPNRLVVLCLVDITILVANGRREIEIRVNFR